jgi:glycosyltransferase involved in cell wall biosynthesis
VIVPVYNEQDCLTQLKDELDQFMDQSSIKANILFVNDGSEDQSQQMIEEICRQGERYFFIKLKENCGLSTAIKAGIDACETNLVGYIDSDIQTHPIEFLKFYEFLDDYELITGIRQKRRDTIVKKLSSKIANGFRRFMINDGIEDTGCPLKIIKTENAKKIPFFDGMHRFLPALIQLQGGKVKQIPVKHSERFAGEAKYHLFNRIKKPFIDTFAFRWMRSRYINYEIDKKG